MHVIAYRAKYDFQSIVYQCPCSDEDCAKVRILRQSNGEWETTSITARMDTTYINLLLSAVWRHDRVSSGRSASLCSDRVSRPTALVGTWKSAARALSHRLEDGARRLMQGCEPCNLGCRRVGISLHKSRNRCASGCQKGALAGGSAKATEGTDTGEGRRRRRNRSENAAPTLAHSKNSAALLALQRICSTAPFPKVTETPEAFQNKAAQRSDAKRSQTAASLPNCLIAAIAIMRFGSAIIDKLSYLVAIPIGTHP